MQQTESEAQDVIARYLSGNLSDSEAARFEDWWARNPAAIHDIDRVARLQDGLHGLRERGELDPLMRRSWWTGTLRVMAMAASIGALGLAVWLWQAGATATAPRLAALPVSFDELARRAPATAQYFMTLRSRDSANTVVLPATPAALHWRLLPDHTAADRRYRVTLTPADTPGGATVVAAVEAAPDGFIDVYVDSRSLRVGQYWLGIEPATSTPGSTQAKPFPLSIIAATPAS
jgi:hypothetical protein